MKLLFPLRFGVIPAGLLLSLIGATLPASAGSKAQEARARISQVHAKSGSELESSLVAQASPDQGAGTMPYRPKPGDKLGYSKEESTKRLTPEHRAFLDGILRLYNEPGLFARRNDVFAAIGTEPGRIAPRPDGMPRLSETDWFRQYAAPRGLFAREGWSADYLYNGRKTKDGKTTWFALLFVRLTTTQECVDSRAVEGYLDLYLFPHIDGLAHPLPARLWDRHGVGGSATAKKNSSNTPGVTLDFVGGCLSGISIGTEFNLEEMSDDNAIN